MRSQFKAVEKCVQVLTVMSIAALDNHRRYLGEGEEEDRSIPERAERSLYVPPDDGHDLLPFSLFLIFSLDVLILPSSFSSFRINDASPEQKKKLSI